METTRLKHEAQTLSPSSSGRRSSASNSPDFQFWMVRNPSLPQPSLVSADELFVNGVLLPLDLLPHHHSDPPDTEPPIPISEQYPPIQDSGIEAGPRPELSAVTHESTTGLTASKRWKDILFKKRTDKTAHDEKNKEKKKERKSQSRTSSAELNINIWPFSRSRSAGNNVNRPRMNAGARKVSSAPCSRSNSAGESKSRNWPSSPNRAGVHLGRTSPVWQVRRGGSGFKISEPKVRNAEKGVQKEGPGIRRSKTPAVATAGAGGGAKAMVLNVNVPVCIGYRHHLSCKSDENSAISVAAGGSGGGGGGNVGGGGAHSGSGGGVNLFNFRGLFSKKVY